MFLQRSKDFTPRSPMRFGILLVVFLVAFVGLIPAASANEPGDASKFGAIAGIPPYGSTPARIAKKLAEFESFRTKFFADNPGHLAPDSLTAETSAPEAEAVAPVNQIVTGIPYHLQQTSSWCGPAATEQILDFDGADVSQSTLASELGTTSAGTAFSRIAPVLNSRRPNATWGPWYPIELESEEDFLSRLAYDGDVGFAGVFHVNLEKQYFTYYNFDHEGHFQTSAGWEKRTDGTRWAGLVDPFNEASYWSNGATTGGFRKVRIFRLWGATVANGKSLGHAPNMIW